MGPVGPKCAEKSKVITDRSATSYIFKGINHDSEGLLPNTTYEFRVSATATINGQAQTIESAPRRTTTLPDLVFAAPELTQQEGKNLNTVVRLKDSQWSVHHSGHVRLGPTTWGNESDGRYEFAFSVPKSTGFQIGTGALFQHSACDWGAWTSLNSASSQLSAWKTWSSHIQLIRCGGGDGTSSITVKVRNKDHDFYAWDAASIPIKRARHRAGNGLSFRMADPLVRNAVPAPPTSTVNMIKESVKAGARAWNTASVGFSFGELQSTNLGLADVVVQGLSTTSKGFVDECGGSDNVVDALACVDHAGTHPHMGQDTLYFEYPPHHSSNTYQWTRDTSLGGKTIQGVTYLYMPVFMAHEFGHTAGLEHPATTKDAMSPNIDPKLQTLTDKDEKAMENAYNNHTAH